ncbi:phosphatase PAP2 family protein [Thioalkalicoccus limnaeus]|uniref:Phosphatase PAP2 family protein n=1 Tax=Thioalkalicoccus limnaeus TaxID=120681 RepID=A0ABV4BE25_9GAMM
MRVPILIWIAFAATAVLFLGFPEIDLFVSGLFYTPDEGFTFRGTPVERFVYHSAEWLTLWGSLTLVALWGLGWLRRRPVWGVSGRRLAFLLLVLALGPGLVVNALLKDHWGRARPANIEQFGGTKTFTPAFVISDQQGGSFSSGHAAAAFFWMAAALLASSWRNLWLLVTIGYGGLVGVVRIAGGGHYLSDVLVSFFIVLILSLILKDLLDSQPARARSPDGRD